ncbi:MAG: hypothetical protein OHK0015_30830 [Chloroflexi bacterium OHK40]
MGAGIAPAGSTGVGATIARVGMVVELGAGGVVGATGVTTVGLPRMGGCSVGACVALGAGLGGGAPAPGALAEQAARISTRSGARARTPCPRVLMLRMARIGSTA